MGPVDCAFLRSPSRRVGLLRCRFQYLRHTPGPKQSSSAFPSFRGAGTDGKPGERMRKNTKSKTARLVNVRSSHRCKRAGVTALVGQTMDRWKQVALVVIVCACFNFWGIGSVSFIDPDEGMYGTI